MPLDGNSAATYKILIIGDASVGKTALLRRLMGRDPQERLHPTIGSDFVTKTVEVDGALVELQIWDTAGQERFNSFTRWQYRGTQGIVMVYDITDITTFTHLSYWLHNVNEEVTINHNKYEAVPLVLLGNKCDLETKRQVQHRDGRKFADKELLMEFLETSALTGENVFEAFKRLAKQVTEVFNPQLMKSYHRHMIREPVDNSYAGKVTMRQQSSVSNVVDVGKSSFRQSIASFIGKSSSRPTSTSISDKSSIRHSSASTVSLPVLRTKKKHKQNKNGVAVVTANFSRNTLTFEFPSKPASSENEVKTVKLSGQAGTDARRGKCCRPC